MGAAGENDKAHNLDLAEKKLHDYYIKTTDACHAATLLNPTLKMEYYKLKRGNGHCTCRQIQDVMVETMKAFMAAHPYVIAPESGVPDSGNSTVPDDPLHEVYNQIDGRARCDLEGELKTYLALKVEPAGTDILKWWSEHANAFPRLAAMARCFLAVPATSAPSERAFSRAKRVISHERHSLKPDAIRACMCMKYWLDVVKTL